MRKYIDKDAVLAELEERQKEEDLYDTDGSFTSWAAENYCSTLESIKEFLETLDVKEVDLEKEINKYISDNFWGSESIGFFSTRSDEEPDAVDMASCARYFYELGLKAQKGE